ncbi:uncharacterized protein LOC118194188 [Stegodyphus dumicola]|uniref:uncharacterized protein LOC118194188 n=1 Tax=Stegodyphus dumicola TaxID=202533 RepID=UPI0015A98DAD|nr:uncharacterized protein LOC118194188 [Stegodyphus dumicola]XP_035221291.1 uncharacterized protein LOC118194188 [Stegodyphus dumicola]
MMKLILAVTILCNVVIAQDTSFVKQVEVSTPTSTPFVLNNPSRKICNEDDRCAIVEYDSADERNITVLYKDCDCPDGNVCVFERDMLDGCAGDENCMHYVDSASRRNRSLSRYVCRKRINVNNYSKFFVEQVQYIISEMRLLRYERKYISTLTRKLVRRRNDRVPADTIEKEIAYLDNILPYFNTHVAYLEKIAAGMQNLKVPPEGTFAYSEINSLNKTIQKIVYRTERIIWSHSRSLRKRQRKKLKARTKG